MRFRTWSSAGRLSRLAALVLIGLVGVSACDDDDPVQPEPEPDVETMRITAGTQTIDVDETSGGGVTGGPLMIQSGGSVTISAAFLRDDGTPDPLVTDAEFILEVTNPATGTPVATFARTGPFAGTLTATQDGSAEMLFSLFHTDEQHDDFGPYPITITVAP